MHHAFLAALQPQRSAVHHSNSAGGADEADEALEEQPRRQAHRASLQGQRTPPNGLGMCYDAVLL